MQAIFSPLRGDRFSQTTCRVSSGTVTTRIAILASGAGTNARALLDASRRGELGGAAVVALLADRAGCGALAEAARAGVEALFEIEAGSRVILTARSQSARTGAGSSAAR